jgi:hypothetical protein
MNYTLAELEQLWVNAGGPVAQEQTAAAIALAESSGNPNAINPTDNGGKQTSWGLWQISNGTHAQPVAGILDPSVNAQAAVGKYVSAGDKFTPWGTYNSGVYRKFLSGSGVAESPYATSAATATPATPTPTTTSAAPASLPWWEQILTLSLAPNGALNNSAAGEVASLNPLASYLGPNPFAVLAIGLGLIFIAFLLGGGTQVVVQQVKTAAKNKIAAAAAA